MLSARAHTVGQADLEAASGSSASIRRFLVSSGGKFSNDEFPSNVDLLLCQFLWLHLLDLSSLILMPLAPQLSFKRNLACRQPSGARLT